MQATQKGSLHTSPQKITLPKTFIIQAVKRKSVTENEKHRIDFKKHFLGGSHKNHN